MNSLLWIVTSFLNVASAMECGDHGLHWLDENQSFTFSKSTPPSEREYVVYFNPCNGVNAPSPCERNDHLCLVETTKGQKKGSDDIVSAVVPFGAAEQGATEVLTIYEDGVNIQYQGATWGDDELFANVEIICGDGNYTAEYSGAFLRLTFTSRQLCEKGVPDKPRKDTNKGGWGFFTWVFVLLVLAALIYAALTVYVNFAQSRGNLPLAADVGDILRELPYLIRDLFRKINFFGRKSSTSGYSAL